MREISNGSRESALTTWGSLHGPRRTADIVVRADLFRAGSSGDAAASIGIKFTRQALSGIRPLFFGTASMNLSTSDRAGRDDDGRHRDLPHWTVAVVLEDALNDSVPDRARPILGLRS